MVDTNKIRAEEINFTTFRKATAALSRSTFNLIVNVDRYWQRAVEAVHGGYISPSDAKKLTLSRGDLYDKVLCVTDQDDLKWPSLQHIVISLVASLLPIKKLVKVDGKKYRYEKHDWKIHSTEYPFAEPSVTIYACRRGGCVSSYSSRTSAGFTLEHQIPRGCNGL